MTRVSAIMVACILVVNPIITDHSFEQEGVIHARFDLFDTRKEFSLISTNQYGASQSFPLYFSDDKIYFKVEKQTGATVKVNLVKLQSKYTKIYYCFSVKEAK